MSMFNTDLYGAAAVSFAESVPNVVARLDDGFQLVENTRPDGAKYWSLQLGVLQLKLFEAGRASQMEFSTIQAGKDAVDVVTAKVKTKWGLGTIQYRLDATTGIDHLCKVVGTQRQSVITVTPKGSTTSVNPEALDRWTGLLKRDFSDRLYETIQRRMLVNPEAFAGVKPLTSEQRGIFLAGVGTQYGGWEYTRPQLKRWFERKEQGKPWVQELDGTSYVEFLGHMSQAALGPMAYFVEMQENYKHLPMKSQKVYDIAMDGAKAEKAWEDVTTKHTAEVAENKIGLVLVTVLG